MLVSLDQKYKSELRNSLNERFDLIQKLNQCKVALSLFYLLTSILQKGSSALRKILAHYWRVLQSVKNDSSSRLAYREGS